MSPEFVLAQQCAQGALTGLAHSARPDAPVLPYTEPRRRIRRLATSIARLIPAVRPATTVEGGQPA